MCIYVYGVCVCVYTYNIVLLCYVFVMKGLTEYALCISVVQDPVVG